MTEQTSSGKAPARASGPLWWGMAGVFPGALGVYEGDAWRNKLQFVAERGFHGGGVSVADLGDSARLATLEAMSAGGTFEFFIHYGLDLRNDPAAEQALLMQHVQRHIECAGKIPLPVAQFIVSGGMHRFDRALPLRAQMDRLSALLRPAVESLRAAGLAAVIENHGDYYVSDLLGLCLTVPGLEILLDTGNCFLIGERPDLIPDEAFPRIAATHFKDHLVHPDPRQLAFQLTGATLGEGDVGLDRFYEKLLRLHPDPAAVRMMIEWVPDPAKDAVACLNASLDYLSRLSNGAFKPVPFAP